MGCCGLVANREFGCCGQPSPRQRKQRVAEGEDCDACAGDEHYLKARAVLNGRIDDPRNQNRGNDGQSRKQQCQRKQRCDAPAAQGDRIVATRPYNPVERFSRVIVGLADIVTAREGRMLPARAARP